jgi:ankyrin repeat protein
MDRLKLAAAAASLALLAAPAAAQNKGFDGISFVGAVRSGDNDKAMQLMEASSSVINARDERGETALIAAIAKRDGDWTGFLLAKGADPNLPARNGDTPLITAARVGFDDAARELLGRNAKVDAANRMGETALIVAVQTRDTALVKLLLELGADPNRTDSAAGLSARDYAKRDGRARDIIKLLEPAKPAAKPAILVAPDAPVGKP